jgi:hypothetical protein
MLKKSALIRDYPGRFQAEAQCFKDGGAKLLLNGAITSPPDHSACVSKALKKTRTERLRHQEGRIYFPPC